MRLGKKAGPVGGETKVEQLRKMGREREGVGEREGGAAEEGVEGEGCWEGLRLRKL